MNTGVYYFLGNHIVISGSDVTFPTGHIDGSRLTDLESKRTYIISGSSWSELNPVSFRIRRDISVSIPAQTLIGFSGFSANSGSNELQVFWNGILQTKDSTPSSRDYDYHFSGALSTGLRFNYSLPPSGIISIIGFR